MRGKEHHLDIKKLSFAGLIITLGVVYGDLGTSPLYTMRAILLAGKANINELLIYGSLSCIFWTLTLQTTIKYIIITLRADNNGEGGIFALFALIKKKIGMGSYSYNDRRCSLAGRWSYNTFNYSYISN